MYGERRAGAFSEALFRRTRGGTRVEYNILRSVAAFSIGFVSSAARRNFDAYQPRTASRFQDLYDALE